MQEPIHVSILRRARQLIERGHTKNYLARNKKGTPVDVESPQAVQFCVSGAVQRAAFELEGVAYGHHWSDAFGALVRAYERRNADIPDLIRFNNDRKTTPEDVLQLFDKALAPYNK